MDRTETYIKMSDCPEIQAFRDSIWDAGDYFAQRGGEVGALLIIGNSDEDESPREYHIWLPCQDDLQEMLKGVKPHYDTWISQLRNCYKYALSLDLSYPMKFMPTSMEQLWLAFVMKELHNKVWDGENWVK